MSIDVQHCTYDLNDDPDAGPRRCGGTTTCILVKDGRTYPRCGRHFGPKTRDQAEAEGYDIHYLEPHPAA